MQHLLDFIHEHTLEEQLYFVATSRSGDLELTWQRRVAPTHWQVRPSGREGPAELVHQRDLLLVLRARQADMVKIERELQAIVITQIAFADLVLRDASALLGTDSVRRAAITVHAGGGEQTAARAGHLSLLPRK